MYEIMCKNLTAYINQCEAITHKTLIYVSDMQEAKAGKTKTAGE